MRGTFNPITKLLVRLSATLPAAGLFIPPSADAQTLPPPILDVHLHAPRATDQGPPPLALCMPGMGLADDG